MKWMAVVFALGAVAFAVGAALLSRRSQALERRIELLERQQEEVGYLQTRLNLTDDLAGSTLEIVNDIRGGSAWFCGQRFCQRTEQRCRLAVEENGFADDTSKCSEPRMTAWCASGAIDLCYSSLAVCEQLTAKDRRGRGGCVGIQ